mgnify:CR=1 FL=1
MTTVRPLRPARVKVPVNETNTADATEDAQTYGFRGERRARRDCRKHGAESAPASVPPVLIRARAALLMATPETAAAPDETDAAETTPPKQTETSDASNFISGKKVALCTAGHAAFCAGSRDFR